MNPSGQSRKLTAILAADVVGYSRLMSQDETATLAALKECRALFFTISGAHGGRIIDTAGDSILAEFRSVVDAVRSAIELQSALLARNLALPEQQRMLYRIGINLGDVIEDNGALYGDGVNVAARLQALAQPGGVCISQSVFEQIETKLPEKFEFIGEQQVKNIAKPVRAYQRVGADSGLAKKSPPTVSARRKWWFAASALVLMVVIVAMGWYRFHASDVALPAASKGRSIAVLPFNNLSGNKDDDYFSDGISEDIITALSRFNDLFVIARNSTFQYKGRAVDVREVGRDLGVRYVLEGSVRRDQTRIRVTAQLLDASTGTHLWADHYDRDLSTNSIFTIQDELTAQVVAKIGDPLKGMISQTGQTELHQKSGVTLSAYECVLKAKAYFATFDPTLHQTARSCLEETTRSDPTYADAWAWLAMTYTDEYSFHYDPRPNSLERAVEAARRSIQVDPSNQMGTWFLARALFFQKKIEEFLPHAERAVSINPNNTAVLAGAAVYYNYAEQWEKGKALIERALALNPNPPWWYYVPVYYFHYRTGDDRLALEAALKMRAAAPGIYWSQVTSAAAYAQLGQIDEAKASIAQLLKLYPNFAQEAESNFRMYNMSAPLQSRMLDGLRKAGLTVSGT